jgi:hypothetical protein
MMQASATALPEPLLSPVEVVALFYALIDQRQNALAYGMFSDRRKAEGSLADFQAGFTTTRNVYLEDAVATPGSPTVVQVSILAADLVNGQLVVRRFAGTWTLVQDGILWKLDRGQIRQIP